MKKRGFTLIELLAVIVVIVIIALIATPIILGVIKESRKGAFGNSASGIMKSAELVYINHIMESNEQEEQVFTYDDYTETDENGNGLKLEYKGQKPEMGQITIKEDGSITLWLWRDGFCAIKGDNDEGVKVTEVTSNACGQATVPPTIMIEGYANNNNSIIITIMPGDTLNLPEVTSRDSYDNDLTEDIVETGSVDVNTPGDYVITYMVTDSNNNIRTRSITVRVQDNVPPIVNFTPNGDSTWKKENGSTVLVEDLHSIIDNSTLKYVWTTSTTAPVEEEFITSFTNNSTIYDSSLTKNGTYYLWILAKDIYENKAIVRSDVFNFDTTAPILTGITLSATNVTESSFTITRTGNATDTHLATNPYTYQISSDGTSWTDVKLLTNDTTADVTGLFSGDSRYYRVCATDMALNSSCSLSQAITTLVITIPSAPELSAGMIPIRWNGSTWIKADTNSVWYNYTNKEWANAVLVTTESRGNYQNAVPGTVILESDVLGYLVWVPRYRYQLFNVEALSVPVQTINIQFELSAVSKSTGNTNGTWLTHPAFTFGNQELNGIWVGKFETSTDLSSLCYTTPSTANCNNANQNPRIKPNVSSLRLQQVRNQFLTSEKISNTTDYGLTTVNDAHTMKNTEWGAVAYLTNSMYGKNEEIWRNNSQQYTTGCAGNSVNPGTTFNGCQNQYYTINGVQASTTGNVYGIYDMAGGAQEYTMSYVEGFIGGGFSGPNLLDAKYYDIYETGNTNNNQEAYNRRILGDATGETRGWYGDRSSFIYHGCSWFERGGMAFESTAITGIFASVATYCGSGNNSHSFRVVILGN